MKPTLVKMTGSYASLLLRGLVLAGRILRRAAGPARWQARHMYQEATVR